MQQNHRLVSITICLLHKNSLVRSTSLNHTPQDHSALRCSQVVFLFVCSVFMLSRIKRKSTQLGMHPFCLILCFQRITRKSLCDLQFISSSTGDNWLCWMTFKGCFKSRSFRFSDVVEKALNWESGS